MSDESDAQDLPPASGAETTTPPSEPPSSKSAADEDPAARVERELEAARADAARFKDQLYRVAADLDNQRKRARREQEDATRRGKEDALRELLPVFDNLERAMQAATHAADIASVADGVKMVLRQFTDTLARIDVVRVQALGQPFDPSLMEAIQQIETAEHPPGAVAAEVQAGYQLGDRLLRPALVVVAKGPAAEG